MFISVAFVDIELRSNCRGVDSWLHKSEGQVLYL